MDHDALIELRNAVKYGTDTWTLSRGEVQFILDPDHYGFPAMVTLDRRACRGPWRRVVEFKMARDQNDADKWGDDGTGRLPADYFAQVLFAMVLTGWTRHAGHLLCVGPRIGDERMYQVEYDDAARAEANYMIDDCRRFYESLAGDEPPDLDKSPATYECIKQLHPDIDGTTIELDADEVLDYATARQEFALADDELQLHRNRLLKRMENAQYAEYRGVQIARRQAGSKGGVSFYPSKTITAARVRELTGETAP